MALVSQLTTPHKLQAEARSRKRVRRRQVVHPRGKPMAEACQLHAVVSQHSGAATRENGRSRAQDLGDGLVMTGSKPRIGP